jgi:hypothetical protein
VSAIARPLLALWTQDVFFFAALTLFNLFLARRTFGEGIWADNDSVCHYAYVRHLLEEFYPATGTFIGWTPKYDLGTPFLLYNTPPGLYVASALVAKLTGVGALGGLKGVVVAAFLSVPLLGAALAVTLEDEPKDLPKFVALALSLFSSELYGVEFYFKNGMLNPAVALPLALACLLFFRRAQRRAREPGVPGSLFWLACAAVAFAGVAFVHLLTTYMLALGLACFAFAEGARNLGRSVLQVGVVGMLGLGLVAFWLVPSLAFAAKQDAAFTWLRNPEGTFSSLLDGSIFSSYPVGFYPRFVTNSPVGVFVSLCTAFALVRLAFRRNAAIAACALTALVALLVALGPRPSYGLSLLPMYDRLLWYRFVTLLTVMALVVAAWGAWQLWGLRARCGGLAVVALVGGSLWAGLVMTRRAVAVETAAGYPEFVAEVDAVSDWLRAHGDRRGRVFSEFLGQNVVESASVNYPRHMIPVLSGFREAGGWVYENNEYAQEMLRLGPFWFDPFPMIELADRYDVQYIVAGSPNFVRALSRDPRWRLVLGKNHLSLFEAAGRAPAFAQAAGWDARLDDEGYTPGGGYTYTIGLAPRAGADRARELLVKTSWSPAWRARAGDREVAVQKTADGLLAVELPRDGSASRFTLTWDIGALRAKGSRASLAALVAIAVLMGLGWLRKLPVLVALPPAIAQGTGVGVAIGGLAVLALRARPIDEHVVGFGARGGLVTTFDTRRVHVGAFDDAEPHRLVRVLDGAWGPRIESEGSAVRALAHEDAPAAAITLSPAGRQRITVRGTLRGAGGGSADNRIALVIADPGTGAALCRFDAALGVEAQLPDACARGPAGDGPGVARHLRLETGGTSETERALVVSEIDVDARIVVVEAESMHNVLDDSGYDALYGYGPPDQFPSNGVSMLAGVRYGKPIALDRDVDLPEPAYDMWLLTRTVSARERHSRAHLLVQSDGRDVGDVEPCTRQGLPFWDDDTHLEWLPVGRVDGRATRRIRVTVYKAPASYDGLADLDALAFVPAAAP